MHSSVINYIDGTTEPLGIIKSYPTLTHIAWFVNRSSGHHRPRIPDRCNLISPVTCCLPHPIAHEPGCHLWSRSDLPRRPLAAGQNLQMSPTHVDRKNPLSHYRSVLFSASFDRTCDDRRRLALSIGYVMRLRRTRPNEVRECKWEGVLLMIAATRIPITVSETAMRDRCAEP